MCLQLVLQMQHTDYSNLSLEQTKSSTVAVIFAPYPLLKKSAAGVELPMFCIHLFFIQTSCVSGVFPFLVYVYFSSLSFLIIVSIGRIYLVTMRSVLSVLFPSVQRGTLL